jgi:hypothetical protein
MVEIDQDFMLVVEPAATDEQVQQAIALVIEYKDMPEYKLRDDFQVRYLQMDLNLRTIWWDYIAGELGPPVKWARENPDKLEGTLRVAEQYYLMIAGQAAYDFLVSQGVIPVDVHYFIEPVASTIEPELPSHSSSSHSLSSVSSSF